MRRLGLVQTLEEAGREGASMDARFPESQSLQGGAVHDPAPLAIPAPVEFLGMFESQQGLGLAIAGLLTQIAARPLSAMMPDEGARRKGNPVARPLDPPADVDVVARFP